MLAHDDSGSGKGPPMDMLSYPRLHIPVEEAIAPSDPALRRIQIGGQVMAALAPRFIVGPDPSDVDVDALLDATMRITDFFMQRIEG